VFEALAPLFRPSDVNDRPDIIADEGLAELARAKHDLATITHSPSCFGVSGVQSLVGNRRLPFSS
jgi:hypothetical protein